MPQHPQYWKNTERDLKDLYDLLNQLERYGIVHEEIHQNIDSLMCELHHDAVIEYAKAEVFGEDDFKDGDDPYDSDDFFAPSAYTLFDYVAESDKAQFIQDLRNVISHCVHSDTWNIDGVADEMREIRDIEYYKLHLHDDENN